MDRYEEALKGLSITDSRSKEAVAPLLKRYLEASQNLQRALTPLNGSVHSAMSRATTLGDTVTTNIDWMSVHDRVGLFDVDDSNVCRIVDAALRYVWRKEVTENLIASVGAAGDHRVAETRRVLRNHVSGGVNEEVESSDEPASREMMTMPGLRTRVAFSNVRPRVCVPSAAALSAVKAVVATLAASNNPAVLSRKIGQQFFSSFQSFLISQAGFTLESLECPSRPTRQLSILSEKGGARASNGDSRARPEHDDVGAASPDAAATALAAVGTSVGEESASGDSGESPAGASPTLVDNMPVVAGGDGMPPTIGTAPPVSLGGDGGGGGGVDAAAGRSGEPAADGSDMAATGAAGASPTTVAAAASVGVAVGSGATDGHSVARSTATTVVTEAANGNNTKALVMSYVVAYLWTKHLPTWRFSGQGKGPAPPGTAANPHGEITVDKGRSLWCPRVSMVAIKPSFNAPALSPRRLRLNMVPDELVILDLTDFKAKKIGDVVAALLFLCTYEREAVRIINETMAGSFKARPSWRSSLVISGLELEGVPGHLTCATDDGDAADGGGAAEDCGVAAEDGGGGAPSSVGRLDHAGAGARDGQQGARGDDAAVGNGSGASVGRPSSGVRAAGRPGVASGSGERALGNGDQALQGDGIQEGHNFVVEAAYYLRVMRVAAECRAKRLAMRRRIRSSVAPITDAAAAAVAAAVAIAVGGGAASGGAVAVLSSTTLVRRPAEVTS